ncbi:lytic polysaccharide monooxygenase auxiliary activity family 9 protein [Amycolatopsis anabasis]|uniref:lytic polysaccharide monooxygenase auxiliary activity family 9 protein n=1 Tax=Amycolatopsis anabasis TaxID=1840409 RepID=UPI001C555DDB|nr:lytic polysaccharide monooxygenase [Amycolatopsis anabasis]
MKFRRKSMLAAAAAISAPISLLVLPASPATAHGTLSDPPSRVYVCKQENPESPKSNACKAAVAAAGTQAFYDWNEVSRLDAGGRHREIIPDGKLCSAGRDKYRGLDLARTDWPAKRIAPGPLTVTYHATAPHANSNFEYYITRDGWNPNQPLKWSDLVPIQTFKNQNPTTFTKWTISIPPRTGRHLLYSIWQRVVGSAEAFYTCSDVDFGGGTQLSTGEQAAPTPAAPEVAPAAQPGSVWAEGPTYPVGHRLTFDGRTYEAVQAHTAIPGWEPPNAPALWRLV